MPQRSYIGATPALFDLTSPSTDSNRQSGELSIKRGLFDEFSGQHGIRGIGAGFVPALLDRVLGRDVQQVHDEEALVIAR